MQAEICAALAHPVRLQILDLLVAGEKTCSDLLNDLEISKANLSQHISLMKSAGILESRKKGTYQHLRLAFPQIKDACGMIRQLLLKRIEKQEKQQADLKKQLKQGN